MKWLRLLPVLGLPFAYVGCGITVHNLTPQAMTRNPSGLYPITVEVVRNDNSVIDGTVRPTLMTAEMSGQMIAIPARSNQWEYTMAVPANATEWPYRFKIDYMVEKAIVQREPRSSIDPKPPMVYVLRITDQTAVGLDARRGRVGSLIKVLGRGFRQGDQILFNGRPVATRYDNENALAFQIPPVAGNKTYVVEVRSGDKSLRFGDLLVDNSQFLLTPAEASLGLDTQAPIEIVIPQPAPPGGLGLRVEATDPAALNIPAALVIPEGQTRIQIIVRAKHIGSGTLMISAEGFQTAVVPFRVAGTKSSG
jgi:hypothetical protein